MITCESLTVEKVEAELEAVETRFKADQKEQKRKLRGAIMYRGETATEMLIEKSLLAKLQKIHSRRARKLRALLAVLIAEQPAETQLEAAEAKPESEAEQ